MKCAFVKEDNPDEDHLNGVFPTFIPTARRHPFGAPEASWTAVPTGRDRLRMTRAATSGRELPQSKT
jgi:hypothetical protein